MEGYARIVPGAAGGKAGQGARENARENRQTKGQKGRFLPKKEAAADLPDGKARPCHLGTRL